MSIVGENLRIFSWLNSLITSAKQFEINRIENEKVKEVVHKGELNDVTKKPHLSKSICV